LVLVSESDLGAPLQGASGVLGTGEDPVRGGAEGDSQNNGFPQMTARSPRPEMTAWRPHVQG
jgi:hypothetical protein